MKDSELALLRSIKKTAAVLLLIMRLDPRPVGETEVAQLLQINRETARAHLKQLSYSHLIARSGHFNSYILTFEGHQLILPSAENPPMLNPTTTTTISESEISTVVVVVDQKSMAENPPMMAENPPMMAENPRMRALTAAGIGEPKRSKLAALPGITPEIIEAWEIHLKAKKKELYTPGLLIRCLESGCPPPLSPKPNDRYDRRRYIEGKYADFIEH